MDSISNHFICKINTVHLLHGLLWLLFLMNTSQVYAKQEVLEVNESNWRETLKGEWLIHFYAPWCPACKTLEPTWDLLAQSLDKNVKVARVDVSALPNLSGRFLILSVPTIYHAKDGEWRTYSGLRYYEDFNQFIKLKHWKQIEPLSKWKKPDTIIMTFVAYFGEYASVLKAAHIFIVEEYALPSWVSYSCLGLGAVLFGTVFGLILHFTIDLLHPLSKKPLEPKTKKFGDWNDMESDEVIRKSKILKKFHSSCEKNLNILEEDEENFSDSSVIVQRTKSKHQTKKQKEKI